MSAIHRLREKIDDLKANFLTIQKENEELKLQSEIPTQSDDKLISSLRSDIANRNQQIKELKDELAEKDEEIEAIITKVETLIG